MSWVMPNKSASQRVYLLNQDIFHTAAKQNGGFVSNERDNLSSPKRLLSLIELSDFQVNAPRTTSHSAFTYLNPARSMNTPAEETTVTIHN